jgi:hypothetical protein
MNANVRWTGEPARCTCPPGRVAATIEETLDCPFAWLEVPGTGWVHTRWLRDPGGAR